MATEFQVTFDSAEPRAHAAFWAEDLRSAAGATPQGRSDALEAECARLVALGARRVQRLEADGTNDVCLVMQDPEGNEFCLD